MESKASTLETIVRFYPEVRSAHLERAPHMRESETYFLRKRSDYDESLARDKRFFRTHLLGLIRKIWRNPPTVLEVPEPMWFQYLPHTLMVVTALRLRTVFRRCTPLVVAYAIENSELNRVPRPLQRLPRWCWIFPARVAVRVIIRQYDRIAFGSSGARRALADALFSPSRRPHALRADTCTVAALPSRCGCEGRVRKHSQVLYLGALEPRKGFDILIQAWPNVIARDDHASLVIVGDGPLRGEAEQMQSEHTSVVYVGAQDRRAVHELLRESRVVVLPSQPSHRWREQVGLPLVEALAHDCNIVTTTETGIADWLEASSASVLPVPTAPRQVAEAILDQLKRPEPSYPLPQVDGRIAADEWLTR